MENEKSHNSSSNERVRNPNVGSTAKEPESAQDSACNDDVPKESSSEPVCSRLSVVGETAADVNEEVLKKLAGCEISNGQKPPYPVAPSLETVPSAVKQSHQLKWIMWNGKRTAIVTQNENGPCPLIAIANILFLRGKITLPANVTVVSASDLLDYIGDAIVDNVPKGLGTATVLNYEQNMHDAISVLPHLPTGLDVNVKFTGVRHFEYTPECIIFDLLNIPLYHGWLVDPQSKETVAALGNFGYNQIVERIIANKSSSDPNLVTEALIAEEFLERTASQLTYHGLCELNSTMKHEELAVLFRNNHFSTILKKKVCICMEDAATQLLAKEELNELFLLVTDQGFLHESRVVWETLSSIDGDGQFVDSKFMTVPPILSDSYLPDKSVSEDQQISHDYLVALSLQEDQKKQQQQQQQQQEGKEQAWDEFREAHPVTDDISDFLHRERGDVLRTTSRSSDRDYNITTSTQGEWRPRD
ncbi:ubiquitin carboxyl-terminal hydrolase MINDY-2 isoform X2 [Anabrus simplex]|uniref:ubiquitin carboxyl-terminal hydrolase MINDY-2 isoform X2 n=1 Tax=Anabrus simplex TaxID=316456 RepID=UPI0035A37249